MYKVEHLAYVYTNYFKNKYFNKDNIFVEILLSFIFSSILSSFYWSDIIDYYNIIYKLFTCRISSQLTFCCTESIGFSGAQAMKGSNAFKALLWYIKKNKTKSLYSLKEYVQLDKYDDSIKENEELLYLACQNSKFQVCSHDDIYFKMTQKKQIDKNENNRNNRKTNMWQLKVFSYSKNLIDLKDIINNIVINYNKYLENLLHENLHVITLCEDTDEDDNLKYKMFPFTTTCHIDHVLHDEKDKIMRQINFFNNNKSWYEKRGKPYTLGILTHGSPGCGKTSFEKALARYLNRHMIIIDFSKIKTSEDADEIFFSEKINNRVIPYNKRMYVFPDVDRMSDIIFNDQYKKEEKVKINANSEKKNDDKLFIIAKKEKTPITLSKILNIMDGVPERTGQVWIMSANNPEKLDKAFLRPGRIDMCIEFKKASSKMAKKILEDFYDENIEDLLENIHEKWTPAEIFKYCREYNNISQCIKFLSL